MRGEAVHHLRLERHVALGMEISVEMASGLDPVEHFDAADLDHAVAAARIEPGGFRVENDFPHRLDLSSAGKPEAIDYLADLGFCCG